MIYVILIIIVIVAVFFIIYGTVGSTEGTLANIERGNIEAGTARLRAQTDRKTAQYENLDVSENHDRAQRQAQATNDYIVRDFELKTQLTDIASSMSMDVATLMSIIQKKQFDDLDLIKLERESRIKIERAIIVKLQDYQRLWMMCQRIDGVLEEMDAIRSGSESDWLKQRKIKEREKDLRFLQEDRSALRRRLLQAHNGPNMGRSDEDT